MTTTIYKYDLVKSQAYLCLAALIETISKTQSIVIDQTEIGKKLGIVLPSSQELVDERELGISINVSKFNSFFKSISLKLVANYIPANTIFDGELDSYIQKYLTKNSHIIVAYNYDLLYKNIHSEIGHVSLVKEIDKDKILLLDPGPKTFGEFAFKTDDLFSAMRYRRGGLLILDKILK